MYDILFNTLGFKEIRNEVFEEFYSKISKFNKSKNKDIQKHLLRSYKQYIHTKNEFIQIKNFIFKSDLSFLYLYNINYPKFLFTFEYLKKVDIFTDENFNESNKEWIFGEEYLKYLVTNIYNMKSPKIAHNINSDNSSILSLNDKNAYDFMRNDWKVIYEAPKSVNYDKILNNKKVVWTNKKEDEFFIKLSGLKNVENKFSLFNELDQQTSSLSEIFKKYDELQNRIVIFHNKDELFALNLFRILDYYYNWGLFGNLYINFEFLKSQNRQNRLDLFAYCLWSLFPINYKLFQEFFEDKIKNKLTDKITCIPLIIEEIIDYFKKKVFVNEKKFTNENLANSNSSNPDNNILKLDTNLFSDIAEKKFFIIFDNVTDCSYKKLIDDITFKYGTNFYFKFIIIYPLVNQFTNEQFINYVVNPPDMYFPYDLYFANIKQYFFKDNEKEKKIKIFNKEENNEELIYDLIRIFNFNEIFIKSSNAESNSNSLFFLTKYMNYLYIEFDNNNKKIIKILFKNKRIEDEFNNKYQDTLDIIKARTNYKFKDIIGQRDGYDLERIIISTIFNNREDCEILELKSIFGLKEIKKNPKINYELSSFILKQKSLGAEAFDLGIKIKSSSKQFLKLYQSTSERTDEEKQKISIEKITIFCSYIKLKFEEYNLGKLDSISFGIISPSRILDNLNKYRDLKTFCRKNQYEFILFDLNERSFFIKDKGEKILINEDLYKINDKYNLNIPNFKDIIDINNKSLQILSPRKVKGRNEEDEDLESQNKAKDYIKERIKRISKFEYFGEFSDLKKLDKNYFCYLYDKDDNYAYFYENKFLYINIEKKDKTRNKKRITLILYSIEIQPKSYEESSIELDEKKKGKLKNKKINKNIGQNELNNEDKTNTHRNNTQNKKRKKKHLTSINRINIKKGKSKEKDDKKKDIDICNIFNKKKVKQENNFLGKKLNLEGPKIESQKKKLNE